METKNLAFYSTFAVEGSAKGIVIGTGSKTVKEIIEIQKNLILRLLEKLHI